MLKGWIIEEQISGIDRWFRANAWVYDTDEKALDLADRRARVEGITKVRVLEIEHTEPRCIKTVDGIAPDNESVNNN